MESLLPFGVTPLVAVAMISASFLTSALTAAIGLGGGISMLAFLGLILPATVLLPVHGAVQLGSNFGRAWHRRGQIRYKYGLTFATGSLVGVTAGTFFILQLPDAVLKLVLGGFILATIWLTIPGLTSLNRWGIAIAATVIGFATMFVGATGPLVSAVLAQIIPDDRKALVATMAAGMAFQQGLKVLLFAIAGFAFREWLALLCTMIATGYVGTLFGSSLLNRLDEKVFRYWFRLLLSLLALDLIRRGISEFVLSPV